MDAGSHLHASLLGLQSVNGLHQHALRLVAGTLGLKVQVMVPAWRKPDKLRKPISSKATDAQVLVNLLLVAVSLQHASQNSGAAHPDHLNGQARIASTLSLTRPCKTLLLCVAIAIQEHHYAPVCLPFCNAMSRLCLRARE